MLLNGEWPRIKRDNEEGNIRQVTCPGLANWESTAWGNTYLAGFDLAAVTPKGRRKRREKTKFTNLIDVDGGVSEIEALVHAGKEDSTNKTDGPCTEGRRRHRGIICVGNRTTDFWIWGFILKGGGCRVKIWVIFVIDSNVLSVPDQVGQLRSSSQSSWKEIEKEITDQGTTLMIRGMVIDLGGPLIFICQ